ncbi:MAG: hypothetical protein LUF30_08995 [Lachnospiraceae bacterium]|nr:hypothetical protein [Lachnospiraceae bacterium]
MAGSLRARKGKRSAGVRSVWKGNGLSGVPGVWKDSVLPGKQNARKCSRLSGKQNARKCSRLSGKQSAWKGSYTVEAAAVVSITILVLASLLIVSFYAHDRAVFQSYVCEIAATGSNYATEKERTSAVAFANAQVTASRFLGSSSLSGSASAGEDEVTASWSASYPVPGFAVAYLADGELSISASWTSEIVEPVETIRLIRGAQRIITGGDD